MGGRFGLGGVYSVVTLYERNTHNLSFKEFILLAAAFILFPLLEFIHFWVCLLHLLLLTCSVLTVDNFFLFYMKKNH